jgi:hypothetical protein
MHECQMTIPNHGKYHLIAHMLDVHGLRRTNRER